MSDAPQTADDAEAQTPKTGAEKGHKSDAGVEAKASGNGERKGPEPTAVGGGTARSLVASLLWLAAALCALVMASGALLVALRADRGGTDNTVVRFVLDAAEALDLGVFDRDDGFMTTASDTAGVQAALANWGGCALAYLVAGKVLDRVVRPVSRRRGSRHARPAR